MNFVEDREHDTLCLLYMRFVAALLTNSLVENGIDDEELCRNILSSFLSTHGYFLDQEWFKYEGRAIKPSLFFGELDIDRLPKELESGNFYESMKQCIVPPNEFGTNLLQYRPIDWLFDLMSKTQEEQAEELFTSDNF